MLTMCYTVNQMTVRVPVAGIYCIGIICCFGNSHVLGLRAQCMVVYEQLNMTQTATDLK